MSLPIVAVVMPVFQGERYVAAAIESILAQTLKEWLLVICDDGSTDDSRQICSAYAARDRRIALLLKQHSGVADTLNQACRYTTTKYIAVLDSDDLAAANRLEAQLSVLEANSSVAVLGSHALAIDASSRTIGVFTRPSRSQGLSFNSVLEANPIIHSTAFMRRSAFETVGGYRNLAHIGAEDYDLWLRIGSKFTIDNLPAILASYRIHPHQLSFTSLPSQILCAKEAHETARRGQGNRRDLVCNISDRIALFDATSSKGPETDIILEILQGFLDHALRYVSLQDYKTASLAMQRARRYALENNADSALAQLFSTIKYASLCMVAGTLNVD